MTDAPRRVLVVGGYGQVGAQISALMAGRPELRVRVAGRNEARSLALAGRIGAEGIALDIDDSSSVERALSGSDVVICCVDQAGPALLLEGAVERGLGYVDITARLALWHRARGLHEHARRTGAWGLIGAGLVPGVANVMAGAGAMDVGAPAEIETFVQLGVGDSHGPAAIAYMLEAACQSYPRLASGRQVEARSFQERTLARLPGEDRARRWYSFGLPSQAFYGETLEAADAATWLALTPGWCQALIAGLVRVGAWRLLRDAGRRERLAGIIHSAGAHLPAGGDEVALFVRVTGRDGLGSSYLARGRSEARLTALSTFCMVEQLLERGGAPPGIWTPEIAIEPARFFSGMRRAGLEVTQLSSVPKRAAFA